MREQAWNRINLTLMKKSKKEKNRTIIAAIHLYHHCMKNERQFHLQQHEQYTSILLY